MKQRTMAIVGIVATALLMVGLLVAIMFYLQDTDNVASLAAMGMMSTGLMTFLVIFGVLYTRPPSDKDRYMEIYSGVCSNCGAEFGEDGICPKCGKRRYGKQ